VEVLGAGHEHDTLVYNPLANAEILIDCWPNVLALDLVACNTIHIVNTKGSREWLGGLLLHFLYFARVCRPWLQRYLRQSLSYIVEKCEKLLLVEGSQTRTRSHYCGTTARCTQHTVLRLMPAKTAEIRMASAA
jgi:hypothetical protein